MLTNIQKVQLRAKTLQSSPTVQKLHQILGATHEVTQYSNDDVQTQIVTQLDVLLFHTMQYAFALHYLRTFPLEGLEMEPILEEIPFYYRNGADPVLLPDNAQVKAFLSGVFERLSALNLQELDYTKFDIERERYFKD
ncbi:hypothetical protein [Helicobacter cynogastricus]|uniref:hypothetical protein n=1 Tax=Helicobacter cynogastricus TaxID=329937 RepID=UPI000CF055F0|nr:hypothetical protein [Helicobacter cynogastricus]